MSSLKSVGNTTYIQNLPHIEEKKLNPINGFTFIAALEEVHGAEKVQQAVKGLLTQSDATFKGVKEFKDRLTSAILGDSKLSVADQKYIAFCVQIFKDGKFG